MRTLPYLEAPEWVQGVLAYHEYECPIRVEICDAASMPGVRWGNDHVVLYAYDDHTGEIHGVSSGPGDPGNPFIHDTRQRCILSPCLVDPLLPDLMLLRVQGNTNGHRAATLYAHPVHAHSLVKEVMPPVSWAVKVVLVATKECKAAYNRVMDNRKAQAIWQTEIGAHEFDAARQECIASGFMTKRRILTARGRSIAGKTKLKSLKR